MCSSDLSTIFLKICPLLAPSTVAASRQSEGKDLSPAAQIMLTQGASCHTLTIITESIAVLVLLSQVILGMPKNPKK